MSKANLLKHLQNDIYCRLGVSKISGVGIFAIKDIPKGTDPFKSLSQEKEKIIRLEKDDFKGITPIPDLIWNLILYPVSLLF